MNKLSEKKLKSQASAHQINDCCSTEEKPSQFKEIYQQRMRRYDCPDFPSLKVSLSKCGIFYTNSYKNKVLNFVEFKDYESVILSLHVGNIKTQVKILNISIHNFFQNCRQKLGSGSYGSVTEYQTSNYTCAIKTIKIDPRKQDHFLQVVFQFVLLKIASALGAGPTIENLFGYDLLYFENSVQFAMEKCQMIKSDMEENKREQLYKALKKLHLVNLIHFDIKPSNICWSPKNESWVFLDFGLSNIIQQKIGWKTSTKFRGTYSFAGQQMKSLYLKPSQGEVDLYYNDTICLESSLRACEFKTSSLNKEAEFYQSLNQNQCQNKLMLQCFRIFFFCKFQILNYRTENLKKILQKQRLVAWMLASEQKIQNHYEKQIFTYLEKCVSEKQKVYYQNLLIMPDTSSSEDFRELNKQVKQVIRVLEIWGMQRFSFFHYRYKYIKIKQLIQKQFNIEKNLNQYLWKQISSWDNRFYQECFLYYLTTTQADSREQTLFFRIQELTSFIDEIYSKIKDIQRSVPKTIYQKFFHILNKMQSLQLLHRLMPIYAILKYGEGIARLYRLKMKSYPLMSEQQLISEIISDTIYLNGYSESILAQILEYLRKCKEQSTHYKQHFSLVIKIQQELLFQGDFQTIQSTVKVFQRHRDQLQKINIKDINVIFLWGNSKMREDKILKLKKENFQRQQSGKSNLKENTIGWKFLKQCAEVDYLSKVFKDKETNFKLLKKSLFHNIFPSESLYLRMISEKKFQAAQILIDEMLSIFNTKSPHYFLRLFSIVQICQKSGDSELIEKYKKKIFEFMQYLQSVISEQYHGYMKIFVNFLMSIFQKQSVTPPILIRILDKIMLCPQLEKQTFYGFQVHAIHSYFNGNILSMINYLDKALDVSSTLSFFTLPKIRGLSWMTLVLKKEKENSKMQNRIQQLFLKGYKMLKKQQDWGKFFIQSHEYLLDLFSLFTKRNLLVYLYDCIWEYSSYLSLFRISIESTSLYAYLKIVCQSIQPVQCEEILIHAVKNINYQFIKRNYYFSHWIMIFKLRGLNSQSNLNKKIIILCLKGAKQCTWNDRIKIQQRLLQEFLLFGKISERKKWIVNRMMLSKIWKERYLVKCEKKIQRIKEKVKSKNRKKAFELVQIFRFKFKKMCHVCI